LGYFGGLAPNSASGCTNAKVCSSEVVLIKLIFTMKYSQMQILKSCVKEVFIINDSFFNQTKNKIASDNVDTAGRNYTAFESFKMDASFHGALMKIRQKPLRRFD
jgi:hypothetical protein